MMTFADNALKQGGSESIRGDVFLPRRQGYHPSPADWRDEVLYFLLVDRFSDGQEETRPPASAGRRALALGPLGGVGSGVLAGRHADRGPVQVRLSKSLGVTAIWFSPILKQHGHLDTYHGYDIIFNHKDEGAIL